MIVTTFPWHWVGILGLPRRMAYFELSNAALASAAFSLTLSTIGAVILLISALLFFVVFSPLVSPSRRPSRRSLTDIKVNAPPDCVPPPWALLLT
ncbi:MAG: hypothetical protein JSR78_10310 [Proteobacteria bacterium]|nr:hypothetical protein [Pseudomonadota bacterium]